MLADIPGCDLTHEKKLQDDLRAAFGEVDRPASVFPDSHNVAGRMKTTNL